MLAKQITYTDYNGEEVTETFYFNMTTLEATKFAAKMNGDIEKHIAELIRKDNMLGIIRLLSEMILGAYGKKSEDGKRFIKNDELRNEFEDSAAFAELVENLLSDPEEAAKFGEGIGTSKLQAKMDKRDAQPKLKVAALNDHPDFSGMTNAQILELLQAKKEQ